MRGGAPQGAKIPLSLDWTSNSRPAEADLVVALLIVYGSPQQAGEIASATQTLRQRLLQDDCRR